MIAVCMCTLRSAKAIADTVPGGITAGARTGGRAANGRFGVEAEVLSMLCETMERSGAEILHTSKWVRHRRSAPNFQKNTTPVIPAASRIEVEDVEDVEGRGFVEEVEEVEDDDEGMM